MSAEDKTIVFGAVALRVAERRERRVWALEEATWALARAMIGEAVLPCGRAVPAEDLLVYLRQRVEAQHAG